MKRNTLPWRRQKVFTLLVQGVTSTYDLASVLHVSQSTAARDCKYLREESTRECSECFQQYDTKIQDKPIKNKSEFKLHSHHDPYQQYDNKDPNLLFVKGINIEARDSEEEGVEIIRSYADKRIQHIRVKGSPAKALSVMNEIEGRT